MTEQYPLFIQNHWNQKFKGIAVLANSQQEDMETMWISIDGWTDEENVVYTYNGILFSFEKELNSDTCCNRDELWKHYSKWNKTDAIEKILDYSTYIGYLE